MRKLNSYGPALIVLGTAIVILLAGPTVVWHLTYARTKARIIQASESLESNPVLEKINQAYRDIAALVEPSVVHVSTERTARSRWGEEQIIGSSGSGWVYDDAGHIVTNFHVVDDAERIEVQFSTGDLREAEIVGFDPFTDIAVIKVEPGRLFPALRADPTKQEPVGQGDLVFAFGSPFDFRFSMSSGVVSGIGRSVGVIRDSRGRPVGYENFIQVDAAINPGNSGGPLTDTQGRVIGMNTAIATGRGNSLDEGQFAGIGLAIPVEMIEPVVNQIIATGSVQKGFLGVSVADLTQTVDRELEILDFDFRIYGLTVARIEPGHTALDTGLRMRDVITHIAGKRVETLIQLDGVTERLAADDRVDVDLWRYDPETNTSRRLKITLPGIVANGFRGMNLLQNDDTIADWLRVLGFTGRGVRIARVELDRPARKAGLHHQDIVTHVNGDPVGSVSQLRSLISTMLPGDVAHLEVWRFEPALGVGRTLSIDVRLDRLDLARVTGTLPPGEGAERVGIGAMATSTEALAAEYGVQFYPGVIVEGIVEGSALDGVLAPGSIIISVMDRFVADVEGFYEILNDYDLRRGVGIVFMRPDGRRVETIIHLE